MIDTIFTWREIVSPTQVRLHFRRPDGRRRAILIDRAHDNPATIKALAEALDADRVQSKGQIKREGLR